MKIYCIMEPDYEIDDGTLITASLDKDVAGKYLELVKLTVDRGCFIRELELLTKDDVEGLNAYISGGACRVSLITGQMKELGFKYFISKKNYKIERSFITMLDGETTWRDVYSGISQQHAEEIAKMEYRKYQERRFDKE